MSQLHTLFPAIVRLDEETHQYFDDENNEYLSFSKLMSNCLAPKFDSHIVSRSIAFSTGEKQSDILDKWTAQRDEGTRIDEALTRFARTGQILDSDRDLENVIKHVLKKYEVFNKTYEQVIVYSKEYRTAGSLDKLGVVSNRKDSGFKIHDFKCFEKGVSHDYKGQKWMNAPLDYLLNSKYNKIGVQLNFYAWHLEKLTGRKCEGLFIDLIRPVKEGDKVVKYVNSLIPIMYNPLQTEAILKMYKQRIKDLLEPTQEVYSDF